MTAINRKVLDISHHNDVNSWLQVLDAGVIGIIHKATEGTDYTDDTYKKRAAQAIDAGLLWGAYHFANGKDVVSQVDHFLDVVGIDDETLYALDWEEDPDGDTMTLEQAYDFLQRLERQTGRKGVVYSGNTAKEALEDETDEYFGSHRLWLAQYSTTPVAQPSWEDWWLWQYSDGSVGPSPHGCPGVSGLVDTNSWDGSDNELRQQWSGKIIRPPKPDPRPPKTKVVQMHIAAQQGVIVLVNGKVVT
jgi:lysozyme